MKIYVDVSETVNNQLRTGIQRVVREVIAHSKVLSQRLQLEVIPVVVKGQDFYQLFDLKPLFNLPSLENQPNDKVGVTLVKLKLKAALKAIPFAYSVAIKAVQYLKSRRNVKYSSSSPILLDKEDVLLLLDSFWGGIGTLAAASKRYQSGDTVIVVIYDLIPLTHSQFCTLTHTVEFNKNLIKSLESTSGVITISKTVADEVKGFILERKLEELPISFFHLGANLSETVVRHESQSNKWPEGLWGDSKVFMIVGTIEPRKGHEFVLDAFERLWSEGSVDKLLILGKVGWKVEALITRIINSPNYGSKLYMVNHATDVDLNQAYERAYACIMASYTEGFGLPLIEALQKGVPVIVSDIPIFREIASMEAEFFILDDLVSFIKAINLLEENYEATKENLKNYKWLSWEDSTEQLLSNVKQMALSVKQNSG